jgi:hypothetical protein
MRDPRFISAGGLPAITTFYISFPHMAVVETVNLYTKLHCFATPSVPSTPRRSDSLIPCSETKPLSKVRMPPSKSAPAYVDRTQLPLGNSDPLHYCLQVVLNAFLATPSEHERFLDLVRTWPPALYSVATMIAAVQQRLVAFPHSAALQAVSLHADNFVRNLLFLNVHCLLYEEALPQQRAVTPPTQRRSK